LKAEWNSMKTIQDVGEEAWIAKLPATGIGDDCAIFPNSNGLNTIISMDTLNEGVHFLRQKISPYDLGTKSLAVNLSDIAAMGGKPQYAFLSVSWSPDVAEDWLDLFILGVRNSLNEHQVELRGGDTNGAINEITITWTIVGEVKPAHMKLRSTARAGDKVCVTSNLGDAAAGLELLLKELKGSPELKADVDTLVAAHLRPRPQLTEGQWLAKEISVHSMMDLSDGLAADLPRLCRASQVGAVVNVDQLPLSPALLKICDKQKWTSSDFSVSGGEDYGLLLTVGDTAYPEVAKRFQEQFGRPLTCIGEIVKAPAEVKFQLFDQPFRPKEAFKHFG
jgi:thiamine-monophosphate kinase